jgi:hypothetical protein
LELKKLLQSNQLQVSPTKMATKMLLDSTTVNQAEFELLSGWLD